MTASAAVNIDCIPEYARLLAHSLPSIIQTEEQNEEYLHQIQELLAHEDTLSPAETRLLKLLTLLIEDFEDRNYKLPKASPLAAIAFLMDQHRLKQKDLTDIFGSPSITSEILNGKRNLNKEQISRLCHRFNVSPEMFF